MKINLIAVLVATVVMFAIGAFWYSVPLAGAWARIHGFDKLSKKQQKEMMSGMGQTYAMQLVVTIISAFVLAWLLMQLPELSPAMVAGMIWLGFVMPAQVSTVLFSNTPGELKLQQAAINER